MTLEDLKRALPELQAEAKALWGDQETASPYAPGVDKSSGGKFTGNCFAVVTKKGWKTKLQELIVSEAA